MKGSPSAAGRRYLLATLLWCGAALAVKPFYPYLDFGVFFSAAIEKILAGAPLDIYSFGAYAPGSRLALPLTYPPASFFFQAPWYALGRLLGIRDFHQSSGFSLGQAWMLLMSLPFDVLLCRETVRLVERIRGPLPEPGRWVLFVSLLYSPLLWLSSVRYGHNEAMMILMMLLAIHQGEEGNPARSGLFWGLALSLKMTALVPALIFFGWGMGRGRMRKISISAAVGGATFLLPLLPYLMLRWEPTWHALVGFEVIRPVGGYVLWKVVPYALRLAGLSGPLILIGSAMLGVFLARRGGAGFLAAGGAQALVLGQVLLLVLGKAIFVWYGLSLGVLCYLAFPAAAEDRHLLPWWPLAVNLLLWLTQAGGWVGEAISPLIRARSALWVVFLLAMGSFAALELFRVTRQREPVALMGPRREA